MPCQDAIGPDLIEHAPRCRAACTGDNNRRHQAMQKLLLYLLRLGGATIVTTPGVASFTAAEPKDPSHAGRQLDLGMHALDDGPPIALDLCVSDCGTGKVSPNYKTGAKCVAKGKTKKKKYYARFTGIKEAELSCRSALTKRLLSLKKYYARFTARGVRTRMLSRCRSALTKRLLLSTRRRRTRKWMHVSHRPSPWHGSGLSPTP